MHVVVDINIQNTLELAEYMCSTIIGFTTLH